MRKMKEDAAKRTPMDDYCSDDEDYVSVSKNVHSDSSPMAKSEEVSDSPHGANGGVKAHSKYHLSLGGVGSSKSNTNSPSKLAYPTTTPRIDLISTSRRGDDEAAEWGSEAESKFENVPYFVEEVSDSEDEEH